MTKIRTALFLLLVSSLFCGNDLFSQGEEALLTQQKNDLDAAFIRQHGNMTHLITGRQHYAYHANISGNPFWPSDVWVNGSLQTRQFFYANVALKYDAHLDAVVFLPDSFSLRHIWVNPELVDYFTYHGKTFIHLGFGSEGKAMESAKIVPGYFELAFKGKALLLIKRTKVYKKYE